MKIMDTVKTIELIKAVDECDGVNEKLRVAAYCRVSMDSDDQINSFIAQGESEHISENVRWGISKRMENIYRVGVLLYGTTPNSPPLFKLFGKHNKTPPLN